MVRIKNTDFARLMRDPDAHLMPALASQRVRVAELIVEVDGRTVLHIVRRVYFVLSFDAEGRVDIDRMDRQQRALAGLAIDAVLAPARPSREVLDAVDRFVAHGGRWQPAPGLAQRIDAAALGGR